MSIQPTAGTVRRFIGPLDEDVTCPITFDSIESPVKTSCGHLFSREGLKKWLVTSPTCPSCRHLLDRYALCTSLEKRSLQSRGICKNILIYGGAVPVSIILGKGLTVIVPLVFSATASLFQYFISGNPLCYFENLCSSNLDKITNTTW